MTTIGFNPEDYGAVTVLRANNGGYYPHGNSLVVRGSDTTVLVDPSLALNRAELPDVDAVLVSHAHEDHLASVGLFAVPVHVHDADLAAVQSVERLLAGYGLPPAAASAFGETLMSDFRIESRPDAIGFVDGAQFHLGSRTVSVVHLPGHTAGHSGFLVEPDGFFYVADIDLTSFGPFYGDLGSSLEDFEESIRICGETDARWFGTFHQKGVIDGVDEFRKRLRAYQGVVAARDAELLAFLREPHSLAHVVAHRLVYRPHVDEPYVPTVEARTAEQHLARLARNGAVVEIEPGFFRAVSD